MPVLKKRVPLEHVAEDRAVAYARSRGCIVRKMNGLGNRSWPDRMFLRAGRVLFIEFKRLGKDLTPLQSEFLTQLRTAGFQVFWTDSYDGAKTVIDEYLCAEEL